MQTKTAVRRTALVAALGLMTLGGEHLAWGQAGCTPGVFCVQFPAGLPPPPDIANGIKPPQVEDLTTARIRAEQLRQLQLENQQRQLQLVEQQKKENQHSWPEAPKAAGPSRGNDDSAARTPISSATDAKSFGLSNGRLWKGFNDNEKLWYVVGFNEGLRAGNREKLTDYFASVSFDDVVLAVNRFYGEPENVLIPVTDSLMIVRSAFNGMSPQQLAQAVADFRRASITPEARTPSQ